MKKNIDKHSYENHEHHEHHGGSHHIHDHSHSYKNISIAFFLNLFFSIIEIVGGIITNSIAIISDAIHDLGDAVSLGVSWRLEKYSKKAPDNRYTYGYARFSLLAALINSIVLIIGAVFVLMSAIPRLITPVAVNPEGMLVFAILGIIINGAAALTVSRGKSFNEKAVSWHMLEDVLGWVTVLIASIVLLFVEFPILDTLLSIGFTIFILYKVFKNLRSIFKVFLEGAPEEADIDDIINLIADKTEALDCHHVHIWTLDGINNYLTAHIVIKDDMSKQDTINLKKQIRKELSALNIKHVTLEIEFNFEECENGECS
jgi:cobalt-zinc-cadmium efflux system protein